MVFHTDLHRFVASLRERLGPQLQNVPLLFQGAPELQDVLAPFDIPLDTVPKESLSTRELRARFQSLVENVCGDDIFASIGSKSAQPVVEEQVRSIPAIRCVPDLWKVRLTRNIPGNQGPGNIPLPCLVVQLACRVRYDDTGHRLQEDTVFR